MGVDIIEAGFPISSDGDFESVKAIASEITEQHRLRPGPLSRRKDIDRAGEAVKHAKSGRIHVFCATCKIHREHKLRKGKEEIIKLAVESIQQALEYTDDVEFCPEDASRTEMEFLEEIVQAAIEAGATTINLPDTVGYATPKSVRRDLLPPAAASCRSSREQGHHPLVPLPQRPGHGRRQLAWRRSRTARGRSNARSTASASAAGNAALEEIVMALRTRGDFYKIGTRIDTTKIYPASRMVSTLTGLAVQRNKAIVGAERLRPRVRHPPGRHAEVPRDLRDHGPGHRRHPQELAGAGQALRPPRVPRPRARSSATR